MTSPPPVSSTPARSGEEMARLTAELLHDLTDVLATHAALIEMARLEMREGRPSYASIQRVQDSGEQIRRMVGDLFDEVRGAADSLEVEFDPAVEAQVAFEHWRTQSPPVQIDFAVDLPAGACVRGRSSFFTRAFLNLLRNAGRHARGAMRARLELAPGEGGTWLRLVVEDDGCGVPGSLQDRLFEPFVHGAVGGTGLGLAMARWGVERLGGTVELAAESPMGGARFVVRLPVARRRAAPAGATASPPAVDDLRGMRIALVDDNAPLASLFVRLANREGATLLHVLPSPSPSAEELARDVMQTRPDAVVLDAGLGRLRGTDVWNALAALDPALAERVVFLSGGLPPAGPEGESLASRWVSKSEGWEGLRARLLGFRRPPE